VIQGGGGGGGFALLLDDPVVAPSLVAVPGADRGGGCAFPCADGCAFNGGFGADGFGGCVGAAFDGGVGADGFDGGVGAVGISCSGICVLYPGGG